VERKKALTDNQDSVAPAGEQLECKSFDQKVEEQLQIKLRVNQLFNEKVAMLDC